METWSSADITLESNTVSADSEIEDFGESIENLLHRAIAKLQVLFFEKRDEHIRQLHEELGAVLPRLPKSDRERYAHQLQEETVEMVKEDFRVLSRAKIEAAFKAHQLLRAAMQREVNKSTMPANA